MRAVRDVKEPLLDFDRLEPATPPPPSRWKTLGKGAACAVTLGGSIALRVASLYLSTNALGSFGIGFSILCMVTTVVAPETISRVRQIAYPIIGQTSIFAFSQAWANDDHRTHQIAFNNTITGLLGANSQLILGWLFQQGAIRNESQPLEEDVSERKLDEKPIVNKNIAQILKVLAAGGLGAVSFLTKDSILQPVAAYFFSFFAARVIGERAIDKIDDKIEAKDIRGRGTRWRVGKASLLTLAYIGQILSFVLLPWRKSSAQAKLLELRIAGGLLGFFDGVLTNSQSRRIEKVPVNQLEELAELPPPEYGWKRTLHRIWKIAVPVISTLGILGFTIWQTGFKLENGEAKIALGTMLGGYLAGTGLCHITQWSWDPKKKHYWRDKLMASIWYSHRFLGVDPIFFYYALINAVKMDSNFIESQKSPYRIAAIWFAWLFYGARMGHEHFIGLSDRIGNVQLKYPKMAMFNSAMTTSYYISGDN